MLSHPPVRIKTVAAVVLVVGAAALYAVPAAAQSTCDLTTTERIVAVGDVHGAYDQLVRILQIAGLIDDNERWAGGSAIFVQTGDVVDRGPDSRRALDLLRRLEGEAEAAGGHVYALLGNHEAMWMYGITRDASDEEYAAFRTDDSEKVRDRIYNSRVAELIGRSLAAGQPFDEDSYKEQFLEQTPLGAIELRDAFQPRGEYGKWLLTHDTMIRINGIVFMHAGTNPEVASLGCERINDRVRDEIRRGNPKNDALSIGETGPLWYRDLVTQPPGTFRPILDEILEKLEARAMIIGHSTMANGQIGIRFNFRVVVIDTGMLGARFYARGQPSALEISGDTMTAIYEDGRELIGDLPASAKATPATR